MFNYPLKVCLREIEKKSKSRKIKKNEKKISTIDLKP